MRDRISKHAASAPRGFKESDVSDPHKCAELATLLNDVLSREAETLEKGLYQIPTDGGQIPMIFREADPHLTERLKGGMSVDKDGFEVSLS